MASSGTFFTVGSHFEYGNPAGTPRRRKRRRVRSEVAWRTLQIIFGVIVLISVGNTFFVSFRMPKLERLELTRDIKDSIEDSLKELRSLVVRSRLVSKIAFGSGTTSDYGPQPVWTRGVIPSEPDVWIWVGDMAYMDEPLVDCHENKGHPQCTCKADWLHNSSCMAGDLSHAKARAQSQISNPDYSQFLEFMCPGHREKHVHPPVGPDPLSCPRRILGAYDDHDYGWQHGNRRLPQKDDLKQVYLDAIGEPQSSPRRSPGRGIEHKYTLNEGRKGQEIDVILLDERYYRDPLPCHTRKDYCEKAVLHNASHTEYAWCKDFLRGDGKKGSQGSCCDKDQRLFLGWCQGKKNQKHALWREACDPTSPDFGVKPLMVSRKGEVEEADSRSKHELEPLESPFCEVIGRQQREWLEAELLSSKAPLKIVVSPSPLLANPVPQPCWGRIENVTAGGRCPCAGDDWECYKPAQLQLLHMAARAPGCVLLVTGDLGYSDIKVLRPGQQPYQEHYRSSSLGKPIYQVMASTLVEVKGRDYSCRGAEGWAGDPVGTRENLECDFLPGPAFGFIQVDWDQENPVVKLQIRDGQDGEPKLESRFTLSQCQGQRLPPNR